MPAYQIMPVDGSNLAAMLDSEPVTIGRHPDNVLRLPDDRASRFHCVLEIDPDRGLVLRDLGSRNGTKVNGERVSEAVLSPGDEIKIGTHRFVVQESSALGEQRAEIRRRAAETDSPWAHELQGLLESLPPKNEVEEKLKLIDGRGRPSDALAGRSAGALAVKMLLQAASKARATDIHCEPKGDATQVRFRVDGQMVGVVDLPNTVGQLAIGLIKTACQFKPTGREVVLDGAFSAKFSTRRVDYRVSLTPSMHGQKLVLRVLDQRDAPRSLSDLELPRYMEKRIREFCRRDSGMLLVSGPTGSGKTTTLYNALREIDRERKNVITIEDPVEYRIDGVTQIPIDDSKGNTFSSLLRSVLRQDPDVLLLGEIRDDETAKTAMQASMTGHLVFSTVHAKDTLSSVFRLLDLKVEPYLVANSIEIILAQRLVRLLCENCKRPVRATPGQATRLGRHLEGQSEVYIATGCAQCLRTGYRGRHGLFELLDFTDELRDVILSDPTIHAMRKVAGHGLFTTLTQSGWQLVARGRTSIEEVDRVAASR